MASKENRVRSMLQVTLTLLFIFQAIRVVSQYSAICTNLLSSFFKSSSLD